MARKPKESTLAQALAPSPQAIEAERQAREVAEQRDLAERTAHARQWMKERGVADRLPHETDAEFRRRTLAWLKENALQIGKRAT